MEWSRRTWSELAADLDSAHGLALLPVGAAEQHGPLLGCGMDFVLANRLCREVAHATGALILPTLPYGYSMGHSRRWPGALAAIVRRAQRETPPLTAPYSPPIPAP